MTAQAWLALGLYVATWLALGIPLGRYLAAVYEGRARIVQWGARVERAVLRAAGASVDEDMTWSRYALAALAFQLVGLVVTYGFQRLQHLLPLDPAGLGPVTPEVAFDTAVSFVSNTNWQSYGGETTMSHLTQMAALTTQNFVSAGVGMAVLVALVRGLVRVRSEGIGSFWVDLYRSVVYVLAPLSLVLAVALVATGVVQTFAGSVTVHPLDRSAGFVDQVLALGPVASQVAIKQLGTNGGGFFNVNSAHPFENPSALSNFLECVAILLLPVAFCFAYGELVKDRRQGFAVFGAMLAIFVPLVILTVHAEQSGNPLVHALGVDDALGALQAGGNMEGKEARFGPIDSALWAVATTAASNGSVNAMHDSFTPLGGLGPLWLMQLGEIVFGGVGSGLYGMLMYVLVAVFIAGLMVGRTPEYLGKKVESFEMKMASLVILLPSVAVLLFTAIASVTDAGTSPLGNPGIHGFSEMLYAFSSAANNNGSAFGGLTASGPFYALLLAVAMWIGRLGVILPVLAIAGSMARKKAVPAGPGTLPTHTPLFVGLLVGTVLLVGALTFIPSLALGPVVEELSLVAR